MMAGRRGYTDIIDFVADCDMTGDYFGLVKRGKTFFISRFINRGQGKFSLYKLTAKEAAEIKRDWKRDGWSMYFVEKWITRMEDVF